MKILDKIPEWFSSISEEMEQTDNLPVNDYPDSELVVNEIHNMPEPVNGNSVTALAKAEQPKNINFGSFTGICVNNFIKEEITPKEFLLPSWLPKKGLAMVYATRGVGKTYFALEVAYAIASGGEFLGWKCPKKARVLFIDGEMPAHDIQSRLKHLQNSRGLIDDGSFVILTPDKQSQGMPDLAILNSQNELNPYLDNFDLIIIDNISTLCRTGKENDAEGWDSMQDWAIRQRSAGRSILFIHHAGKGGQQRGTSKREDVMDTVIALKRPSDYQPSQGARFEVHFEKTRGFSGEDAAPLEVNLSISDDKKYSWNFNLLEDSLMKKILELEDKGLNQSEIADALSIDKSTVSRRLKMNRDNL